MTAQVAFRRYHDADHDAVWSLFVACTSQLGFALGPWDDDMHHIPAVYLSPGGDFIVGEQECGIGAMAALYRHSDERAEVREPSGSRILSDRTQPLRRLIARFRSDAYHACICAKEPRYTMRAR
jgi:hypothetical protein